MASKLGFRQHLLLLLFLDIFAVMFIGFGSSSILSKFIAVPNTLTLSSTIGIGLIFATLFIAVTSISVTTGSNFVGVPGIIMNFLGKNTSKGAILASVTLIVTDYILLYQLVIDGSQFGWFNIIAMLVFYPLIIDALFASLDWARGANT